MKRCPKCSNTFNNETRFCTYDGTPLVSEMSEIPSEYSAELDDEGEFETVIRTSPVKTRIPVFPPDQAEEEFQQPSGKSRSGLKADEKPKRSILKYLVIIAAGFLLVGVFALALLGGGYLYYLRQVEIANAEKKRAESESIKRPDDKPAESAVDHSTENTEIDESTLNGKVIKAMVNVRSKPNRTSAKVGTIPKNDRLNIIKRESNKSPWYQIECEHGTRGWMHGNTIAFTN